MIRVRKQPEPQRFDTSVRIRGNAFLGRLGRQPTGKDWKNHNYWKEISDEMYDIYDGMCAYSGQWISNNDDSIDHFFPKSRYPDLAYEWDNYRLCLQKLNNNKADNEGIADPFDIVEGDFVLDIPSCYIKPGNGLSPGKVKMIEKTIDILKLNDDSNFVSGRANILTDYANDQITIDFLRKRYPFIASEIERQNIMESVKAMFKRSIHN